MRDWMGRDLHYLRISLTERCNLKCIYCREENGHCQAGQELSLPELTRLMGIFTALGITKVRRPAENRWCARILSRLSVWRRVLHRFAT